MDGLIGFGKDQLPSVIEQLMLWQLWVNGLVFILFLILALLAGYLWKKVTESDVYNDPPTIPPPFGCCLCTRVRLSTLCIHRCSDSCSP
ncbi:hypothetical protein XBO1_1230041 [Xenorhabdus bovienii str. oregonense]|uniref:Uncharacterized protein n=2 Tax=Xenorhabdus bovienii TaxID=40576 RepID=A0A077NZS7_XENBV|nr:hypothetical protein XBO1_1230041 [Xenorhabdus bovienii str. oregonense]